VTDVINLRILLALSFDKPDYHQEDSKLVFRPLKDFQEFSSKLIWKGERPNSRLAEIFLTKITNEINNYRK
jgi:hypothetical protein